MVNDVPRLVSLKKQNGKVVADTLFTYSEQNPLAKEVMLFSDIGEIGFTSPF